MSGVENCHDFVRWLGADMSAKVFLHLDDPSDLARVCSVSSSWRQFVIANELSKQLCLKMFPEISSVTRVIEVDDVIDPLDLRQSDCTEWECLKRNHRVYAMLARGLSPFLEKGCISAAIGASSTDNNPEENIRNTLVPSDRVENEASYWSSKGQSDIAVPEILVYRLIANLCLVTEIHVQPFQAFFQYGCPIYSCKTVRFRLGHPKSPLPLENDATVSYPDEHESLNDKFIWTYISPEYPMAQENCLQKFKLPEPVLCIGGILQVELLGRVQRQEMDGLYYICISHVQVVGWPLSRPFDVEMLGPTGKCKLKYHRPEKECCTSGGSPKVKKGMPSRWHSLTVRLMGRGVRGWENMILGTLLGTGAVVEDDDSDD